RLKQRQADEVTTNTAVVWTTLTWAATLWLALPAAWFGLALAVTGAILLEIRVMPILRWIAVGCGIAAAVHAFWFALAQFPIQAIGVVAILYWMSERFRAFGDE